MSRFKNRRSYSPEKASQRKFRYIKSILESEFCALQIPEGKKNIIRSFFGLGGHCEEDNASDLPLGYRVCRNTARLMQEHASAAHERVYYVVELIDEAFSTSARSPVLPLGRFQARANRAIAHLGLPALIKIDILPLVIGSDEAEEARYILRAKAIVWADSPIDAASAEARLNGRRGWYCSYVQKAASIEAVPVGAASLNRALYDMMAPVTCSKRLVPLETGGHELIDSETALSGGEALRLHEGLSQILYWETFYGVGNGRQFVRNIRASLKAWQAGRTGTIPARDFDKWRFWLEVRKEEPEGDYTPYRIDNLQPQRVVRKRVKKLKVPRAASRRVVVKSATQLAKESWHPRNGRPNASRHRTKRRRALK